MHPIQSTPQFIESLKQFEAAFPDYVQTRDLDQLRARDYARLDDQHHVYLDYTGGSLYAMSQVSRHHQLLADHVFGNPHSTNPSSQLATRLTGEAREKVLSFFNAGDYDCVFTPNATGALKIVGECYPFSENSHFLLPFDNHNSVNGIREFARKKGCPFTYSPITIENLRFSEGVLRENLAAHGTATNKLFAYPAQSNVSGVKHDLAWIGEAQKEGWDVLLDASAFVPTSRLDLSVYKPEFVSMSFYKMFGYPTGLGALLVRKDVFPKLKKPWFAGGTVTLASVMADRFFLDQHHARFEDGTINYLDIPALTIGLEHIESIGIDTINQRVMVLTDWLLQAMRGLVHRNGKPLIQVFGPQDTTGRGATIILNLFGPDGRTLPFIQVEQAANAQNFSIRTGCFCNPGIDEINNELEGNELLHYFDSHESGDYFDMQAHLDKMRGAIRISLGLVSNFSDVFRFVEFLKSFLT
ncbi:MAG: aminotransferase class V-fold PLP-dependent enzyme [Cyclobacteriaceae bacterium]|nr:aminotransferase class V-fold PLP-dependent enzyme [Cyclobacteriaceae bacterium]